MTSVLFSSTSMPGSRRTRRRKTDRIQALEREAADLGTENAKLRERLRAVETRLAGLEEGQSTRASADTQR